MTLGGGLSARERRSVFGLLLLAVLLAALLGATVWVGTTDPHGLIGAPSLNASDLGRVEPLYGGTWTPTRSIDWSPDGRWIALAGGESEDVLVLSAPSGAVAHVLSPSLPSDPSGLFPGSPEVARWSPDGRFLAVGANAGWTGSGWIYLYTPDGRPVASWEAQATFLEGLAWSPDGTRLVTMGRGMITIWDVASETLLHSLRYVNASDVVDWSPDGALIAFGNAFGFSLYNATTAAQVLQVGSGGPNTTYVEQGPVWSHSGSRIATVGNSGCAYLYDRAGTLLWQRDLLASGCASMWGRRAAWNPTDSMIAVPTEAGLVVLDAATGHTLRVLAFPVDGYGESLYLGGPPDASLDWGAAWSPDGTAIASVAERSNPSLHVWGIRRSPVALLLAASEGATAVGLPVILGGLIPVLWPLRGPKGPTAPSTRFGAYLLLIWFALSIVEALRFEVFRRTYQAWIMPPAAWFVDGALLSVVVGLPAVAVLVLVLGTLVVPAREPRPPLPARQTVRFLGPALIPVLWFLCLGLLASSLLQAAGLILSFELAAALTGAFGGVGLLLGGLAMASGMGISLRRSAASLFVSGIFGVLAAFGITVGLVFVAGRFLNGLVSPEVAFYGLSVFFSFGLTPIIAAIVVLALAAGGSALVWAYPPRLMLGLFSRLTRDDVLRLDTRRRVLDHLQSHPGAHFREIMRSLGLASGTLHYHLYVLEREGLIIPWRDGMYRRFAVARQSSP